MGQALNESGRTGLSAALKTSPPGQDAAGSRLDPPDLGVCANADTAQGGKRLINWPNPGNPGFRRHAT